MHLTAHQLVISEFDPPLTVVLRLNQSWAFESENWGGMVKIHPNGHICK